MKYGNRVNKALGAGSFQGMTLVEIMIGVVIFAVAMLPILSLTTNTAKGTYSMSKHLIGSQIAASVLDRLVSMPFERAKKIVESQGHPIKVLDCTAVNLILDEEVKDVIEIPQASPKSRKFSDDLGRMLKSYQYTLSKGDPFNNDVMNIMVKVEWSDQESHEGGRVDHDVTWCAAKYKEE